MTVEVYTCSSHDTSHDMYTQLSPIVVSIRLLSNMTKVSRQNCLNCTCSPGLLLRSGRRSSLTNKINLRKSNNLLKRNSVISCQPIKEVNTSDRLLALRNIMLSNDISIYIVPSSFSFISGFNGSSATAIITVDISSFNTSATGLAALATDGRYFLQAANDLDFNWVLLKQGVRDDDAVASTGLNNVAASGLNNSAGGAVSGGLSTIGEDSEGAVCEAFGAGEGSKGTSENPGSNGTNENPGSNRTNENSGSNGTNVNSGSNGSKLANNGLNGDSDLVGKVNNISLSNASVSNQRLPDSDNSLEISWEQWTINQAIQLHIDSGKSIKIGVDPKLITYSSVKHFNSKLKASVTKNSTVKDPSMIELVAVQNNLVDQIWDQFEIRPPTEKLPIKSLDEKFTGRSSKDKFEALSNSVFKQHSGLVISSLDEIAWLLNLRGQDVEYNPVFNSFLIYTQDQTILFVDKEKLSDDITNTLSSNNITIEPYDSFCSILEKISRDFELSNKSFLIPNDANWQIIKTLKCNYNQSLSPVEDLKSIKNSTEIRGAKLAHLKDGRALIKFFSWLEEELIVKHNLVDEVTADEKLTEFRRAEENFAGLSFATISATGANGAIIHYSPTRGNCSVIDPSKIYLNDSGSQFLEGTTDTTRTLHFGQPTQEEIRNYTLVLKGNISLATQKFPEGTTGNLIDAIARQHLWKYGLDYGHGTSHGVGSYLNVHEGPIGIGPRPNAAANLLKPGHLISNEPGFYKEGEYGIRIETVMITTDSRLNYNGKKFYQFETITRVPFCRKLIDPKLLSNDEIRWVNNYHRKILDELKPSFDKSTYAYKWLKRETNPL